MKSKALWTTMLATMLVSASAHAAVINITNFSLTPDGSTSSPVQTTDIYAANGNVTIVNAGSPVAYFVSTFTFGSGALTDLQLNFAASAGQDRLGIKITDNGQAISSGDGSDAYNASQDLDLDGAGSNAAGTMAGQTITIIGRFQFDANFSVTYGESNASNDTFATFWINPTGSDLEGSGLPNGYGGVANANFTGDFASILWNSSSFYQLEQRIFNNSTPGTAGSSSIVSTTVLTGTDATWSNALALATVPEPSTALLGALGSLLLLRRRRR